MERNIRKEIIKILIDFRKLLRLRIERNGMVKMEGWLKKKKEKKIGIENMVVDGRVLREKIKGILKLEKRVVIKEKMVIGKEKRIKDIEVMREKIERFNDNVKGLIEVLVKVKKGIKKIVKKMRMIGIKIKRIEEIGIRIVKLM